MSGQRGILWRLTDPIARRSRERRFQLFMQEMEPQPTDRVLDVGVTDADWRSGNFFESRYPWPAQITAVAPQAVPAFTRNFPEVDFVAADGRQLPFADNTFDIGFSNAVVEHVGSRANQKNFVSELARTCRRVFICTPNAAFPVDPHTLLPFVHWLPRSARNRVLRATGNDRWASEEMLNPLRAADLLGMFGAQDAPRLVSQRLFFVTSVLIAVNERPPPTDA